MADRDALLAEQADLQRKLKKREGALGYTDNTIMIRARLAKIAQQLANG